MKLKNNLILKIFSIISLALLIINIIFTPLLYSNNSHDSVRLYFKFDVMYVVVSIGVFMFWTIILINLFNLKNLKESLLYKIASLSIPEEKQEQFYLHFRLSTIISLSIIVLIFCLIMFILFANIINSVDIIIMNITNLS